MTRRTQSLIDMGLTAAERAAALPKASDTVLRSQSRIVYYQV